MLSRPLVQIFWLALVLYHYIFGIPSPPHCHYLVTTGLSFAYGCIFLNCSSLPRPAVNLECWPLNYFGEISYGIYMYHPLVGYALRYTLLRWCVDVHWLLLSAIYFVLFIGLTIGTAAFSYRYFERVFSTCAIFIRNGKPLK